MGHLQKVHCEMNSAARIIAVWMLQVTSKKGSQDQYLRTVNREEQLRKVLQGGSISS